jgi:hypothetical protein
MMLGVSIPNQAASGPPHASTARARRPAQVLRLREVGTRSKWGSNMRTTGTTKTVMNRPAARGSQAPSGRSARRLDRSSGRARKRAGKQPRPGARAGASGRDAGWAWSLHRNQWWPPRGQADGLGRARLTTLRSCPEGDWGVLLLVRSRIRGLLSTPTLVSHAAPQEPGERERSESRPPPGAGSPPEPVVEALAVDEMQARILRVPAGAPRGTTARPPACVEA